MAQFALKAVIEARDKISSPIRKITARLAPLRRAFARVGNAARGIGRNIGRALRPLALIGGAALAGLAVMTKRFVTATDSLAKFLKQVEFAPEAFQRLEFAAGQSGVAPEEFRKGIEKLSKNVGDFKLGLTTLSTLLKSTSPEFLKQLKSVKSNAEAFDLVRKKIQATSDVQKKAAIAQAIFGRSGQKLLPLFASTAEELAELNEQFFSLGKGLTGRALKAAEDTQDAFGRMSLAVTSVKGAIFEKLLPVLTPLIDKVSRFVGTNRELIALKVNEKIAAIATAVRSIDFAAITGGIKTVVGFIKSGIDLVGGFKNALLIVGVIQLLPLLSAVGSLISAIAIAAVGATGLTAIFISTAIPIVIAAIAAGAFLIVKHWKPIKAFFSNLFGGVSDIILSMLSPIGIITLAVSSVTKHWKPLKTFFFNLFDNIKGIIFSSFQAALKLITKPVAAIKKVLGFFGIGDKVSKIPNSIKVIGPKSPIVTALRSKGSIKLPKSVPTKLAAIAQTRSAVTASGKRSRDLLSQVGGLASKASVARTRPLLPALKLGPAVPSPIANRGRDTTNKVAIKVDIANAPIGTRVTTDADPGVELTTDMGVRFGGGLG